VQKRSFGNTAFEYLVYLAVIGALAAAVFVYERSELNRAQANQQVEVNEIAEGLSRSLAAALTQKSVAASGIAQTVSLLPSISQDQFSTITSRIIGGDPSVVVTSLISDWRITHVHPLINNESIIGSNLRGSTARVEAINRVLERGYGVVQGPVRLLVGDEGFIVRLPVLQRQPNGEFAAVENDATTPALVSLVFAAEPFFSEVGIDDLPFGYDIAIRSNQENEQFTVYGEPDLFSQGPSLSEVSFPLGTWEIAIAPSNGWITKLPNPWPLRGVVSFATVFLLAMMREFLGLREENQRFSRMLKMAIDTMADGFVLYDENDRLVICNEKYKEFYPKSAEAMVPGATFKSILEFGLANGQYAEAKGREEEWLKERLEKHFSDDTFVEQELDDGRWLRIVERAAPNGSRAGLRVDVTELKKNEQLLEDQNMRLSAALEAREKAEARFADLTEFSSEWFWEQDDEHRFTYFSDGFERATGIDASTLLGKRRDEFGNVDPNAEADRGLSDVIHAIEEQKPFQNCIYSAMNVRSSEMWIRTSGKPVFDKDGAFQGYRGVAADVTQLYQAVQEAKLAAEAKTRFLSMVSHELRTPLTVLLGYNAFITNSSKLPSVSQLHQTVAESGDRVLSNHVAAALEQIGGFSKRIDVSGRQLLAIVSDLLDSTRMDNGKFRMELGRVSPKEDLQGVLQHHRMVAQKKGVEFIIDLDDVPLHADQTRLQQVLSNLVGNAIKFTSEGSITVTGQVVDNMYQFEVRDTGIGMEQKDADQVFKPFYQVDPTETRNHQGIGLGLAITKRIVQSHGGEISVSSAPGVGSTFVFTIPIYELAQRRMLA
jgi:PAS domain S-box-containing protein